MSELAVLTVALGSERDVVLARQRAREIAGLLGLDAQDRTRVATAVSEVARNAVGYAGGGRAEFSLGRSPEGQELVVRVRDEGPGIPHLDAVLSGRYVSPTGLGIGLLGARRLADRFSVETSAGGTEVLLAKSLPRGTAALTAADAARISAALAASRPESALEELRRQNLELLRALEELRARQAQLDRLNAELEDTNRGVVALYAELDEKAESLRRASDVKTRFLSNMSHEFRTPLSAIRSLTGLLLDRVDGELSAEQEKQVSFIRRSAEELSVLVDDLLDISKVEAGKVDVRPEPFDVADMFAALRGMLRPLAAERRSVSLAFDEPVGVPRMRTDEGKVAQILRNLISNALKYTESGEVRVSARAAAGGLVELAVADTGIGIPRAHQERIFEEFEQVENALQSRTKGTGLGLPLSRRLARLLGGTLTVASEPGAGSTFTAAIPAVYRGAEQPAPAPGPAGGGPLLLIDDDEVARYVSRDLIGRVPFEILEADGGEQGLRLARTAAPRAVLLDLSMPGLGGEEVLAALRADPATAGVPVLVYTSKELSGEVRARLGAAGAAVLAKGGPSRDAAAEALRGALAAMGVDIRGSEDGRG